MLARLGLALPSLLGAGCASHGIPLFEAALEANATLEPGPMLLLPGDTIQVSFPEKEDWNHSVEIRSDHAGSFWWIGEIETGGRSVEQVEIALREAYARIYPDLEVNVGVTLLAPRNIHVMGEVEDPGVYPIKGRLSLLEGLTLAGGPIKETAMLEYLLLVRWSAKEGRQRSWRIDAAVEQWEEGLALLLQPHDVIFVPNTPIDDVDIWVDQYIRRLIPFPYTLGPVQ
jgi:protein involved in polysaccharide export with SLBB domain